MGAPGSTPSGRSEEHTSELQSRPHLVCRLLLEKKKLLAPASIGAPSAAVTPAAPERRASDQQSADPVDQVSRRRCGRRARDPVFFFNDTATTEIYTLSLHDALPI